MKFTEKNKDLIQSYVVTTAKYDFSAYEKRVLYRIIEMLQPKTKDLKLKYDYSMKKDLFDNVEFTVDISAFLAKDSDKNHTKVKQALTDLRNKSFQYEDEKQWGVYGIIEMPKIVKYQSQVKFTVTPLLMDAFLNFSKGYRKFELKTAMSFESVYSMRFYELFSGKTQPITYSITELKEMFKIKDKYSRVNDFIKRVIVSAQKEMDKSSPYSFKYEPVKTGRKITHITFKPYFIPKNRDEGLVKKELKKDLDLRWVIDKATINILIDKFEFTKKGIKNNQELILKLVKSSNPTFQEFIADVNGMIRKYDIQNKPGFFIGQLKKIPSFD